MKLTSRALKVGDKIIRKSPLKDKDGNNTNSMYVSEYCTIVEKHPHHTVVREPYYVESTNILPHSKWNDNEWIRWNSKLNS